MFFGMLFLTLPIHIYFYLFTCISCQKHDTVDTLKHIFLHFAQSDVVIFLQCLGFTNTSVTFPRCMSQVCHFQADVYPLIEFACFQRSDLLVSGKCRIVQQLLTLIQCAVKRLGFSNCGSPVNTSFWNCSIEGL